MCKPERRFNLETVKRCSPIESPSRLRLRTISFSSCQSLKVSSFGNSLHPGSLEPVPCLRTVNEACTLGHMWGMNHPLHYAVLASISTQTGLRFQARQ